VSPVDILQLKRTDLAAPDAVGVKQMHNSVIPADMVLPGSRFLALQRVGFNRGLNISCGNALADSALWVAQVPGKVG